jgi:hypothetical protein
MSDRVEIPRDFWREVPCGHPPDPVAAFNGEQWVCHCGHIVGCDSVSVDEVSGHRIFPCGKCGCYVGVPLDHPEAHRARRVLDPAAG